MASMNEKDYYAILEVDEKATTDEIRRAFQRKARKLHPDVNKEPDAEDRFKEVSEAYAVLSDADKRARYDAMRSGNPFAAGGGSYGGSPYTGGTGYSGGSPFDGFPFGGTWTRRSSTARSYRPRVGADLTYEVDLDGDQAREGARRSVTYERYASCGVCGGTGSVRHAAATTCPTCGGAGRMRVDMGGLGLFGLGFFEVTCPECEGSGKVVVDPCTTCGGTGRVMEPTEIVIDIPQNSHDGDEVRVSAMGNAGTNGKESGDFVVKVRVEEERLAPQQESGFRLLGFALPFVVVGVLAKLTGLTVLGTVMVGVGAAMVVREGLRANARWWRSAGMSMGGSLLYGALFALALLSPFTRGLALLMVFFMATSFMMGRR